MVKPKTKLIPYIVSEREYIHLDAAALKRGKFRVSDDGMFAATCENCGFDLKETGEIVYSDQARCRRCQQTYEIDFYEKSPQILGGVSVPRQFVVMRLRTLGPSNVIRGRFLGEISLTDNRDERFARVWNKSRKRWTKVIVDLQNSVEVADWRPANYDDLANFGYELRSGYHLI